MDRQNHPFGSPRQHITKMRHKLFIKVEQETTYASLCKDIVGVWGDLDCKFGAGLVQRKQPNPSRRRGGEPLWIGGKLGGLAYYTACAGTQIRPTLS